ncbi:hypothetical protein ACJIZ3_016558 [Penstemon smallii]|uniref:Transmembrane protein n=1 Tax=Penstemon smallii TaxID=265156 RepID=A0ABD3STS5_9LAMI
MEYRNSKDKEVVIDIDSGHGASLRSDPAGKKSLSKVVSGVLGFNAKKGGGGVSFPNAYDNTIELLVDKNPGGQELVPLIQIDREQEKRKAGNVNKAPKPPRPPKGPSLDAADMRLVREISRIAMKKRERIQRMKALKKMKAAAKSSSSTLAPSSGSTISAMLITVLFFLVIIFQAPQPAPATKDLMSLQFYNTVVMSDDVVVPNPGCVVLSTEKLNGSEFSSPE